MKYFLFDITARTEFFSSFKCEFLNANISEAHLSTDSVFLVTTVVKIRFAVLRIE